MDKNKKQIAGMQEMSPDDLGKVTGGETRRVVKKEICPICGEEITVPLATHMRAGGKDTVKSTNSTIFLDSKC